MEILITKQILLFLRHPVTKQERLRLNKLGPYYSVLGLSCGYTVHVVCTHVLYTGCDCTVVVSGLGQVYTICTV